MSAIIASNFQVGLERRCLSRCKVCVYFSLKFDYRDGVCFFTTELKIWFEGTAHLLYFRPCKLSSLLNLFIKLINIKVKCSSYFSS